MIIKILLAVPPLEQVGTAPLFSQSPVSLRHFNSPPVGEMVAAESWQVYFAVASARFDPDHERFTQLVVSDAGGSK